MGTLDHIHLMVPDRYEAARWYVENLGFEIVEEYEFAVRIGAACVLEARTIAPLLGPIAIVRIDDVPDTLDVGGVEHAKRRRRHDFALRSRT